MQLLYDNINNYSKNDYKNFFIQIKKDKKERIKLLQKENTKKRSILGEILFIKLLNKNNINYNDIEIILNENGKPYIKNSNIYYNISHSENYVICAISNHPIGIDIEKIRLINLSTINQYTTSLEKDYISNDSTRALEIYTTKEAYIKCIGSNILHIKEVHLNPHLKKLLNNNNYTFKTNYNTIKDYIISICEEK